MYILNLILVLKLPYFLHSILFDFVCIVYSSLYCEHKNKAQVAAFFSCIIYEDRAMHISLGEF